MSLKGKTALVTGASRGLGKEIARQLLVAGANVVISSKADVYKAFSELWSLVGDEQKFGYVVADLAYEVSISKLAEVAGAVDILVNCAAIQGPVGTLIENTMAAWQETMAVNVFGPVALCRKLIPHMKEQKWGKIINISGGGAFFPRANHTAYAASKSALVSFSQSLAEELKQFHIDVSCVSPGPLGPMGYRTSDADRDSGFEQRAAALVVALASHEADGLTGRAISAAFDDWQRIIQEKSKVMADLHIYALRREIGWME